MSSTLNKGRKQYIIILLFIALLIRIIFINAAGSKGDIGLYISWGNKLLEVGFSDFYSSVYCDYPPAYLYILYCVAFLADKFSNIINPQILIKMPAILFDLLTLIFVYVYASRQMSGKQTKIVTIFCALNPMTILNSAVWGQVDSIFTFFLIICIYMLIRERYELAAVLFAVALAFKPQALLIAPLFLYAFAEKVRDNLFYWLKRLCFCLLAFAVTFYLIILPFSNTLSPLWIMSLYTNTMSGYSLVSLNAYNLWWVIGAGWIEDSLMLGPLSYADWGYIFIILSVLGCGLLFIKMKGQARYYYIGALLVTSIFMLSCRMHERYLYPAVLLYLFAYIYDKSPLTLSITIYFSIHNFLNQLGSLYWAGSLYGFRTCIAVFGVIGLIIAYAWGVCKLRLRQNSDVSDISSTNK